MLVPLAGALRTYFNHTTITTELRNFPLSVMTSSKILPTKQPGLPFSGPAGRRVWRRHHQFTPIDWAKMGNASKAHHSSKDDNFFATNPPLFLHTLRNSIYRKIKKCTTVQPTPIARNLIRSCRRRPTSISATAATHWLSRFLPILSMATRSFTFTKKNHSRKSQPTQPYFHK